jgi:hypothetical protein
MATSLRLDPGFVKIVVLNAGSVGGRIDTLFHLSYA